MYTCADIVYGYDLGSDSPIHSGFPAHLLETLQDEEPDGIYMPYSGSGAEPPCAFCVVLDSFDECQSVLISSLEMTVTDHHKEELNNLINGLDSNIADEIRKLGEPKLFILWSTS